MKPYVLYYWGHSKNHATSMVAKTKDVLISDDTINSLTECRKIPPFIGFIVDDGQKMIVNSDLVLNLVSQPMNIELKDNKK